MGGMSTQNLCQVECMPNDVNTNTATQDTTTLPSTSGLGKFPPESEEWRRPRSVLPYDTDEFVK